MVSCPLKRMMEEQTSKEDSESVQETSSEQSDA